MNLLDRIVLGYLKSRTKGLNPNQPNNVLPVNSFTIQSYTGNDFVKAYASSVALYSVAGFLVRKAASIPWYEYKLNGGKDAKMSLERYRTMTKGIMASDAAFTKALAERKAAFDENAIVENSALARRLKRPNENQSQDQFFESLFGFRILSGEANIWGNSGDLLDTDGEFAELQILPTQYVDDYYDPADLYGILGYRLTVGKGINIAKENLARWKNWHPDFDGVTRIHMRGLSVVKVAWKNYLMEDNGGSAMANMLKNGGAKGALSPAVVGTTPTRLSDTQLSEAIRQVNIKINGNENANSIGVLAGPYDYLNFGMSAVDMQIVEIMNLTMHQWCRMLGLPTVLFDSEHTSDNNYQNALRDVVTNTIVPMMASVRDVLNSFLLPRFGLEGKSFIDFDISALPELQRDIEKMVNSLAKAYWLTEDEKRVMMNYEPKGGIYDTSLVQQGLVKIDDVGLDLSPIPNDPNVQY